MTSEEINKLKEEAKANIAPVVKLPDECLVQLALLELDFTPKAKDKAKEENRNLSLLQDTFYAKMALTKVYNTDDKVWIDVLNYEGLEKAIVVLEGIPSVTAEKYFAVSPDKKNNFKLTNWDLKFDRVKEVTTEREAIIQYALWLEVHWNIPFDGGLILLTDMLLNKAGSNALDWTDIFPDGKPDDTDLGYLLCVYRYYEHKTGERYPNITYNNYSKAKKSVLDITTHGAKIMSRNDRGAIYNLVAEIIEQRKANAKTSDNSSEGNPDLTSDIPF